MVRRAALAAGVALLIGVAASAAAGRGEISTTWRVYSARIDYDNGSYSVMPPGTRRLVVSDSGWRFGSSAGAVRIVRITGADWKRWRVTAYGPTRKAVFAGWSGGAADGPLEESAGRVDFIWVIYRARPPLVHAPGTVSLKFGRLNP